MFSTSHIQPHRSSRCFALSAWSLEVHQVGCSCISCRYRSGRVCRAGTISSPDLLPSPSELRLGVIPIHVVCCAEVNISVVRESLDDHRPKFRHDCSCPFHALHLRNIILPCCFFLQLWLSSIIAHLLHMQQQAQ